MTSSFSAAWQAADPRALAFLSRGFEDPAVRARVVGVAAERRVPSEVLEALNAFHAGLPRSAARDRNLALLSQPSTTVVVTGQQVGLFLGPLYTVYKAASAIVAARALSSETGRPCVPIFWLQTEDHDLPEIDHVSVPTPDGPMRIALPIPDAARSRIPVAHVPLGAGITPAFEQLRAALATEPHAAEHLELLARAYRPDVTIADAFTDVIAHLFADEGLLFVNPRDPRLAPLAAPVHRRALADAPAISQALQERSTALSDAGFSEQVHIRPGCPLSFFSSEGPTGPRYRPDAHRVPELLPLVDTESARFTTSALLRPILQDTWLPTAAYIGGPGEIAYYAQMAPLYAHFGLPPPMIVLRSRFRVVDDRTRSLLARLGLTADEASTPRDQLLARLCRRDLAADVTPEHLESRFLAALEPALQELRAPLTSLDPQLVKQVDRTDATIRKSLGKLIGRYTRALAQRDQLVVERVLRIQTMLFPDGAPQERVYGLPSFAARYGTRAFLGRVLSSCVPFSGALQDLTP